MSEDIELDVEVLARTEHALFVRTGVGDAWVPRSQISDYVGDADTPETIFVSDYIATERGLI